MITFRPSDDDPTIVYVDVNRCVCVGSVVLVTSPLPRGHFKGWTYIGRGTPYGQITSPVIADYEECQQWVVNYFKALK